MSNNSEGLTKSFEDIEEHLQAALEAVEKATSGELIFLVDAIRELIGIERAKLRYWCALRALILGLQSIQEHSIDGDMEMKELIDRRQFKVEEQLYKLTDAVLKLAKVNELQVDLEAREKDEKETEEMQYI